MLVTGGRYTAKAEDVIRQSMHTPREFVLPRTAITRSRKKPITGDMVQMCADLGIEPHVSFLDAMERAQKTARKFAKRMVSITIIGRATKPKEGPIGR